MICHSQIHFAVQGLFHIDWKATLITNEKHWSQRIFIFVASNILLSTFFSSASGIILNIYIIYIPGVLKYWFTVLHCSFSKLNSSMMIYTLQIGAYRNVPRGNEKLYEPECYISSEIAGNSDSIFHKFTITYLLTILWFWDKSSWSRVSQKGR